MKKNLLLFGLSLGLMSCATVDNWMLGKDNTKQPNPLTPVVSKKVALKSNWQQSVNVRRSNSEGLFKLKPYVYQGAVYTAASDGSIQKRNPVNAKVIWSKHLNVAIAGGPVVNQGLLAVGTEDANVFVLDANTGETKWHALLSNSVLSAPKIEGSHLVVKTIDSTVYDYNVEHGVLNWKYQEQSPDLILRAASSPLVTNGHVYIGFANGKVYSFSTAGQGLWMQNVSYSKGASEVERMVDVDATPIVANGNVYAVGYQGQVAALAAHNGQVLWHRDLSSYRNMTLKSGVLYLTDSHSGIWAVNASNGSVLWRQDALNYRGVTAPVASPLGLLIADKLGYLHVLSYQNGTVIGRAQVTSDIIDASPTVAGRDIFVQTAKGMLYQLTESPAL